MELSILSALVKQVADRVGIKSPEDIRGTSAISNINASSLMELGKVAEVEAITVVDNTLTMYESTTDVLKYLNSLYASSYLSAAAVLTDTGRVKTVQLLSKLNPSKSPGYAITNSILSGLEAGVMGALTPSMLGHEVTVDVELENGDVPDLELADVSEPEEFLPNFLPTTVESFESAKVEADKDTLVLSRPATVSSAKSSSDLTTVQNLSVGQAITLTITDGDARKDVTVNIRLLVVPVSYGVLATIMRWSTKQTNLRRRLSAWRAGELRFWRDVVFMRDIFTERKRLLMSDNSDLFQSMLGRQKNSMINSILAATPDVGNMSSILVISEDNLASMEATHLDGKISNFAYRQQVMNNTGLMIIAVVNPMTELVTVYTHTQALPSELSLRQLKSANKGGADALGDLVKLMNQNKMPSF